MAAARTLAFLFVLTHAIWHSSPCSAQAEKAPSKPPKVGESDVKAQPELQPVAPGLTQGVRRELRALGSGGPITMLGRVLRGIAVIISAWVVYLLAALGLGRVEGRLKRAVATPSAVHTRRQQHITTVTKLARSFCRYVVIIGSIILLLDWSFGLNVIPIVTGAGLLGLAVAFGSQALVRDVITGIFQLLEGQYAVGDFVQIGSAFGRVEEVGLRVTRLRDLQHKLHFIPNGTITLVTTYEDTFSHYVLHAPFSAPEQKDSALEAVRRLSLDLRREFPELIGYVDEPEIVCGETELSAVKMRLGIVPTQDWIVTTELPARVKEIFAARAIKTPESRAPSCYVDISPLARMPRGNPDTS